MQPDLMDRHTPRPGRRRRTFALVAVLVAVLPWATALAQKSPPDGGKLKSAARVAVERRYAMAPGASVGFPGAISSLRIVGWDRDSLVITGTVPVGWRFDGGVATATTGPSRG